MIQMDLKWMLRGFARNTMTEYCYRRCLDFSQSFSQKGGFLCWVCFGSQEMVQNQLRHCNITSTIAESCVDVGAECHCQH